MTNRSDVYFSDCGVKQSVTVPLERTEAGETSGYTGK